MSIRNYLVRGLVVASALPLLVSGCSPRLNPGPIYKNNLVNFDGGIYGSEYTDARGFPKTVYQDYGTNGTLDAVCTDTDYRSCKIILGTHSESDMTVRTSHEIFSRNSDEANRLQSVFDKIKMDYIDQEKKKNEAK